MRRAVIGLDLSLTRTGACLIYSDGTRRIESYPTGNLRGHERLDEILGRVWALVHSAEHPLIVIEGMSFGSKGRAVFDIAGLNWIVRHDLWLHEYEYIDCPPSTLKKWATGKGNAPKNVMLTTAIRKFGYDGSDDNEADALLLALWGMSADPPA